MRRFLIWKQFRNVSSCSFKITQYCSFKLFSLKLKSVFVFLRGVKGSGVSKIDFILDLSWKKMEYIIPLCFLKTSTFIKKVMVHGLIGLKFWEESDLDLFWTRVDLCWLVLDSCWLVLDSCWLVLTRVGLSWYSMKHIFTLYFFLHILVSKH